MTKRLMIPLLLNFLFQKRFASILVNDFDSISEYDKALVMAIISKPAYRFQLIGFFSSLDSSLTQEQRVGLVYFVGFVDYVDDIIDSPDFPKFDQVSEFKEYLMKQKVVVSESLSLTVLDYLEYLRKFLNNEALVQLDPFLNNCLSAQFTVQNISINYSYEFAWNYRVATTGEFCRLGMKIAKNFVGPVEDRMSPAYAWQEIDDVLDALADFKEKRVNIVVGMANDAGELEKMEETLIEPSSFFVRIFQMRWLLSGMPKTRTQLASLLDIRCNQLTGINFFCAKAIRIICCGLS